MTELDKTPLRKTDFKDKVIFDKAIEIPRLLGAVEGLRERFCRCSQMDKTCIFCEEFKKHFGVLK